MDKKGFPMGLWLQHLPIPPNTKSPVLNPSIIYTPVKCPGTMRPEQSTPDQTHLNSQPKGVREYDPRLNRITLMALPQVEIAVDRLQHIYCFVWTETSCSTYTYAVTHYYSTGKGGAPGAVLIKESGRWCLSTGAGLFLYFSAIRNQFHLPSLVRN